MAGKEPYDPTPEEISERCAEIRRGWSKRETARRCGAVNIWRPPIVRLAEADLDFLVLLGEVEQ